MTKLLDEAVKKLSQLPAGRQNELARMLIDVAAGDLHPYVLSDDEQDAIDEALAQANRSEFANEEDVTAMWNRFAV
jgi:predicted transcriptional regulator